MQCATTLDWTGKPMLNAADRDEVEQAIRSGIYDAYRLGIGVAIEAFESFQHETTDPQTWLRAIEHLRRISVSCTLKED